MVFVYSEKLQKKPTGLGRAGFVPASDASNRIAGGMDSDEPGFVTSLKVRLFLRGFLLLFIYYLLIAHDLKIGKAFLEK